MGDKEVSDFLATGMVLSSVAAWLTSLIHAIKHDSVVLALVDIFLWPIGIIHGFGLWFGWW